MNKEHVEHIVYKTALYFGIEKSDIVGKSRKREILYPRYHLAFLLKIKTTLSLMQIGYHIGRRDHSTIINALEQHEDLRGQDTVFMTEWDNYNKHYNDEIAPSIGYEPKAMTQDQLNEYARRLEDIYAKEQLLMKEKELLILEILHNK